MLKEKNNQRIKKAGGCEKKSISSAGRVKALAFTQPTYFAKLKIET